MFIQAHSNNKACITKYMMLALSAMLLITACKKEIKLPPPEPEPPAPTVTRTEDQRLRDSIYHYYKLYSLWTNSIQPADPISSFTDRYSSAEQVLNALMAQTPRHPGYNGPFDRFSFLDDISSGSNSSRADNADGYGIYTTILWDGSSSVGYIHVFFVEGGSPAAEVGVKRGDRLISVNGRTNLEIPISSSGTITNPSNRNFVINALEGNRLDLEVEQTNGQTQTYSLEYKTYPINPLLKDTVYVRDGKKIGYLALSSFEEIYGSGTASAQLRNNFETIFNKFESENISDLILDFRYNIGGYMHTAEYFANKIINNTGNGQLMYTYETNDYLKSRASGRSAEFRDVLYNKDGNINVQNLYFLVTENTASASEVIMSATKPYFNVQVIAETNRTYGKPVGYFPQEIMGRTNLWVASFKAFHPDGYNNYWDGIPATKSDVLDNILKDYGDPEESMISEALSYATTGTYKTATSGQQARTTRFGQKIDIPAEKIQDINKLKPRNLIKK